MVKAVTRLAELWGISDVFYKTATTGYAASLLDGCTIHSTASLMKDLKNIKVTSNLIIKVLFLARRGVHVRFVAQWQTAPNIV